MGNEIKLTPDGKIYLRKSMIESFNFCPMQFRKSWIEGISQETNYKMIVGTRFHEFAYWFFDVCQAFPPEQWVELVPNVFTPFEQDMARWWIEQEHKRYIELDSDYEVFMPVQREIKLEDDSIAITGTCDRLDWIDKDAGIMAITEYKTGGSYDEASIIRQLAFYKLIWDNTIKLGDIKYLRYINPRRQDYKLIPMPSNVADIVYLNISKVRKAIREDILPYKCSAAKHPICNLCDAEECGAYNY